MDSTVPADLLKLKARLEAWRATRKYARQPIPDEFRQAAAEMTGRYQLGVADFSSRSWAGLRCGRERAGRAPERRSGPDIFASTDES